MVQKAPDWTMVTHGTLSGNSPKRSAPVSGRNRQDERRGRKTQNRDHVFVYDNPMHTDTTKGVLTTRLATHQPDLIPQGNMDVNSACDTQHACLREYDVQDDPTSILALLTEPTVIKFDTGASRCMSGDPDRIGVSRPITRPVRITGFN